jgi:hypothetical protein
MTPEEKDKLFTAIGYSENAYNLALPKQVGVRCLHMGFDSLAGLSWVGLH